MANIAQLIYVNRAVGNGMNNAPSTAYKTAFLEENIPSAPTDAQHKTIIVAPIEGDIYLAYGTVPDLDNDAQTVLVPLGSHYEVVNTVGMRISAKLSGTNSGTGAGGGSGGASDVVKLDATQNTVKLDATQNTVKVSGNVAVTGPATDAQLRATPLSVSGPLTDTQLRATALPVSGSVGVTGSVAVTGPVTNAQLTAVTGAVADAAWGGTGNATVIALLKAIHAQLVTVAANTAPTP